MKKLLIVMLAFAALFIGCKKESSEKRILRFQFANPSVEATINEGAKTIVANMPEGTDVTNLVPMITISDKASVDPASGIPQDFTNPRTYVVTAENGSNVSYTVTVTVGGSGGGGGGQTTDPTTIDGNISANTTWPDLGLPVDYIIDGYCYIEGNAMLTIEPGVTIMFTGSDCAIIVEENAGIHMVGTPDKHIRLVNPTNNNNHGAWRVFRVESNRADNMMEYVDFINGGSDDGYAVLHVDGNAKLSVKHCLIDGSLGNGIQVDGTLTAFENNTIKNCEKYPMEITNANHVNQLGTGNTYTANTINMIWFNHYCIDNGTQNSTFTFTNQGVPYHITEGMNVDENNIMVVEAGCEFVFGYDEPFTVSDGSLIKVNGTAAQPVIFRGESNEAGLWRGIEINTTRSTNGGSNLTNCIIKGAGIDEDGALYLNENTYLNINGLSVTNSGTYGLSIEIPTVWDDAAEDYIYDYNSYHVTATGLTFSNCANGNIWERAKGVVLSAWPN